VALHLCTEAASEFHTSAKKDCFEFADGSDPHQGFLEEPRVLSLKFMRSKKYRNTLMVLENRGCIHLIKAVEYKLIQMHCVNIGPYAVFDLNDDDTKLFSMDVDLKIKIFIRFEEIELSGYKEQVNPDDLKIDKTLLQPALRKASSKNTGSIVSPTRKKKIQIVSSKAETNNLSKQNTVTVGWAFYLVKEAVIPDIPIKRVLDYKNVTVQFIPGMACFMTVVNFGDIVLWTINGEEWKRIKNIDIEDEKSKLSITIL